MLGQMMTRPLLISSLIEHAARYHAETEIVSVNTMEGKTVTSWGEVAENARRLASALTALGLEPQARCATLAWNNRRHLECYYGISGAGYVCHTINPRLHPEQLTYILNHAEDRILFIEKTFLPLIAKVRGHLPHLEHVILLGPQDDAAAGEVEGLIAYDDFIAGGDAGFVWPEMDENTASSLCYTSGTTGHPKGVLYSHRSTVLHAYASNTLDCVGYAARDVVLPVVPMFHVNAWGSVYACAMSGARLVMPGPDLSGAALVDLIDTHKVTLAMGVPTIWLGLLAHAKAVGSTLDSLERTVVGGSACPPSMITEFREGYGVDTVHAWGMTEMSPLGSVNMPLAKHADLPIEEQRRVRESQGRPVFGVDLKVVGENGRELPRDGKTAGDLHAQGHWVLDSYYKSTREETLTEGWFDTGDVATLDADGYLCIRDRSKDIIKSGGEWISSVELENIAMGHPDLANAAVVGARHAKWDERPILVCVRAEGADPSEAELRAYYEDKVAHWQIPDRVIFVDALPLGATGKVLKRELKDRFRDVLTGESIAQET
ncbi:MAG: long-chain-fatty-acid--CoA ligase [Marinibacterium sp.]